MARGHLCVCARVWCIVLWIAFGETARTQLSFTPRVGFSYNNSAMPFQIPTPLSQASVEKRSADGASPQQAKKAKLPPLSDLVAMEAAPKRQNAQRLPAVGPLNIVVYKVRPLSDLPLRVSELLFVSRLTSVMYQVIGRSRTRLRMRGVSSRDPRT